MKTTHSIKKSINCLQTTFKNAHTGLSNISSSKSDYIKNSLSFFYQTFFRDLPYLFLLEVRSIVDKQIGNNEITQVQEATQDKIVILIPGFLSNCNSMKQIKQKLDTTDIEYIAMNIRLNFLNVEKQKKEVISKIREILEKSQKKHKQVTIFGYSYGGAIGSHFAKKGDINLVTYGTPIIPEDTPFAISGNYYGIQIPKNARLDTKRGKHIVEKFSFANPENQVGDRIIIHSQLSHFGINHSDVTKEILKQIELSFKATTTP